MDDQLLEKRLESLKKAYNDMPEDESRSAILAAIRRDQKKKAKNKWFHFPYAASFIGVGMIAGVLMMQYVGDHIPDRQKTELNQAAMDNSTGELEKAEVKTEFDKLREYYSDKELKTKKKLGFGAGFENYLYRNIPMELDEAEADFIANIEDRSQQDLADTGKSFTGQIDQAFTLPFEIIERLSNEKHDQVFLSGDEFRLLNQLDSFVGAYFQSMVFYEWEIEKALEQESVTALIKKMNAGGEGIAAPGLRKLAAGAVENGYAFREENGRILPFVNFTGIAERLKGNANEDYLKYLELRSNRVHNNQGKVISYKNYADVLVKLEKAIATVKDPKIEDRLREDVQSLYGQFAIGSPGNPIYGEDNLLKEEVKNAYLYLMETYPKTDTAAAVKVLYEKMKKENFQKPANDMEESMNLVYPKYMNIPANLKSEDIINRRVLPLSDFLLSSYKEFAAKKNFNILKHYGPFEIMQLYFHADKEGDYATMYALFSKNGGLPPEEQYIKEQQEAEMDSSEVLKGYDYATLYHPDDEPEKVIGIQLHLKDRSDAPVFRVVQEDGFWKVIYLPIQ